MLLSASEIWRPTTLSGKITGSVRAKPSKPDPRTVVERPLVVALLDVALHGASAVIRVRSSWERITLLLDRGRLVLATSDRESDDDGLATELVDSRLIPQPMLDEIRAERVPEAQTLAHLVYRCGALGMGELRQAMRRVYAARLTRALAMTDGQIGVEQRPHNESLRPRMSTDVLPAVAKCLRDGLDTYAYNRLVPLLNYSSEEHVWLATEDETVLDTLGFSERQWYRLERLLGGDYTERDIIRLCTLAKDETAQLLLVLKAFRLLVPVTVARLEEASATHHLMDEL